MCRWKKVVYNIFVTSHLQHVKAQGGHELSIIADRHKSHQVIYPVLMISKASQCVNIINYCFSLTHMCRAGAIEPTNLIISHKVSCIKLVIQYCKSVKAVRSKTQVLSW